MTDKKGIRSLFAIDVLPEEQEAQDRAKETIMQRLNVKPNELQAAEDRYITPLPEIKFEPTFYQPTKTKEQLEEKLTDVETHYEQSKAATAYLQGQVMLVKELLQCLCEEEECECKAG